MALGDGMLGLAGSPVARYTITSAAWTYKETTKPTVASRTGTRGPQSQALVAPLRWLVLAHISGLAVALFAAATVGAAAAPIDFQQVIRPLS